MADLTIGGVYFTEDLEAQFGGNIRLPNGYKVYTWKDHDDNYLDYDEWRASASAGMTINNISADGEIYLKSGNATTLTLDSSQNATFAGTITSSSGTLLLTNGSNTRGFATNGSGHLQISNAANSAGVLFLTDDSLTLGSAAGTGSHSLFAGAATFSANVVLDDASGASPQVQWINGSDDTGGMYLNSSGKLQIVTGGSLRQEISSGSTEFTGACMPSADSTYDLGTTSYYWANAYIDVITTTGNITIGGDLTSGNIRINEATNPNLQLYRSDATTQLWELSIDSSGRLLFQEAASSGGTQYTRFQIDDTGEVTMNGGSLYLGTADTSSGHINAYENMTFNIDIDNDDTNRYFAWYTNSADGGGTELLKILETGAATFAGDVTVDGGDFNLTKQSGSPTINMLFDGNNPSSDTLLHYLNFQVDYSTSHQDWGGIEHRTTSSATRTKLNFNVKSTGGNVLNALSLDGTTDGTTATFGGNLIIPEYIKHSGDTDTFFKFISDGWEIQSSGGPTTDISATDGVTTIYGKGVAGITVGSSQLATFAGVLNVPDGSVSSPSIGNTGDTNTGMYWPADEQLGFTVAGSRKFYMSTTKAFFQNLSSGVEIDGSLFLDSDSAQLQLGDDNDMQVYHNGANGQIISGTGNLYLDVTGSDDMVFRYKANDTAMTIDGGSNEIITSISLRADSGIVLNGNSNIQEDTSLAAGQTSGTIIKFGSGIVTAGKIYALYATMGTSTWQAVNHTDAHAIDMLAVSIGTSATSNGMLLSGILYKSSHGFTVGDPLYLASTDGDFTTTVPTTSNYYARVVGYAIDSNHIYFCPDNTWVEIA